MREAQKRQQKAAAERRDNQRARYLMRRVPVEKAPARACLHCGATEEYCPSCKKMHPFIANLACSACGNKAHVFADFGTQLPLDCANCGTRHYVFVDKRGDISKVVLIGKDLVTPDESCSSESLLPVSLPSNT